MKGTVSKTSYNDTQWGRLWTIRLQSDDTYYNCGKFQPECNEGDIVEFEGAPGKRSGTFQVDTTTVKVVEKGTSRGQTERKPAFQGRKSRAEKSFWDAREEREVEKGKQIEIQACRNTAIAFVDVLAKLEAVKLPAAQAKKLEALEQLVEKYTNTFLDDNATRLSRRDSPIKAETQEAATTEPENEEVNSEVWD